MTSASTLQRDDASSIGTSGEPRGSMESSPIKCRVSRRDVVGVCVAQLAGERLALVTLKFDLG